VSPSSRIAGRLNALRVRGALASVAVVVEMITSADLSGVGGAPERVGSTRTFRPAERGDVLVTGLPGWATVSRCAVGLLRVTRRAGVRFLVRAGAGSAFLPCPLTRRGGCAPGLVTAACAGVRAEVRRERGADFAPVFARADRSDRPFFPFLRF
jgi:hypothetical protein